MLARYPCQGSTAHERSRDSKLEQGTADGCTVQRRHSGKSLTRGILRTGHCVENVQYKRLDTVFANIHYVEEEDDGDKARLDDVGTEELLVIVPLAYARNGEACENVEHHECDEARTNVPVAKALGQEPRLDEKVQVQDCVSCNRQMNNSTKEAVVVVHLFPGKTSGDLDRTEG